MSTRALTLSASPSLKLLMGLQIRSGVLCEIQNVLAVLRRNTRFTPIARSASIREDGTIAEENALTRDLNELRGSIRNWPYDDLSGFSAIELVLPFLAVLRSPEANGVLTDAAIKSLQAFLGAPLLGEDSTHASEAVAELVEALIGCRFEETQEGHDEAVRARIIQLLVACLEGGAGTWLPDEMVWEVLQTCMANLDQMSAHSPLLRMVAEDGVFRVVRWIFARLPSALEHPPASKAVADDTLPPAPDMLPPKGALEYFRKENEQPVIKPPPTSAERSRGGDDGISTEENSFQRDGRRTDQGSGTAGSGLPCVVKVLGFLCSQLLRKGGGGGTTAGSGRGGQSGGSSGAGGSTPTPRRLLCLRLLRTALATAGGPALASFPPLLDMLRDDLSFALLHSIQGSGGVSIIGEVLSIVRYLWGSMRIHLKVKAEGAAVGNRGETSKSMPFETRISQMYQEQLRFVTKRPTYPSAQVQFELLFGAIFLRGLSQLRDEGEHSDAELGGPAIAPPTTGTAGQREPARSPRGLTGSSAAGVHVRAFKDRELEMVLEGLCDFMSEPTFLVELYVNYDCDLQRSNLTELLVAELADGAYAAPDQLPGARALCLVSLSAALRHLHSRCVVRDDSGDGGKGIEQVLSGPAGVMTASGAGASTGVANAAVAAAAAVDGAGLPLPSRCREAKKRKHALALAGNAFCAKPREGLKLLQLGGFCPPGPLDARAVASFLRSTPGLDKAAVGSYLGEAGMKRKSGVNGTRSAGSSPVPQGNKLRRQEHLPGQLSDVSFDQSTKTEAAEAQKGGDQPLLAATATIGGGAHPTTAGQGDEAMTSKLAAVDAGGGTAGVVEGSVLGTDGAGGGAKGRVYDGDTVEFHAEVLTAFVETFNFRGQSLLASLRMFLEAFRLPGEAQQIDRILHAFAQRAYRECVEAARGMLASPDVAYLFTFSVIMLNTDLHNPNIRPEKRMTCNGFINNNINYGRDISGDRDLPRDFLESVYLSIKDDPITTFGGGPDAPVSADRWRDLLRRQHDENSLMAICRVEGRGGTGGGLEGHDRDVVGACWPGVLKAASAAFAAGQPEQDTSALGASVDLFLLLASLAGHHPGLQNAFDKVILLLCRFTGLLGPNGRFQPGSRNSSVDSSGSRSSAAAISATSSGSEAGVLQEEEEQEVLQHKGAPGQRSQGQDVEEQRAMARKRLSNNPAARTAALTAFGLAHRLGDHMRDGWIPLLHLVFAMRDLRLLPKEALTESGEDLLERRERDIFNAAVINGDFKSAAAVAERQNCAEDFGQGQSNDDQGGGGGGGDPAMVDGARTGASVLSWVLGRPSGLEFADGRGQYEAVQTSPQPAATAAPRRSYQSRLSRNSREIREKRSLEEADDHPVEFWNEAAFGSEDREVLSRSSSDGSGGSSFGFSDDAARLHANVSSEGVGDALLETARRESVSSTMGPGATWSGEIPRRGASWPSPSSAAFQCVAQCRVQDLVGESRRLGADAFLALLRALIAAVHTSLPLHERRRFPGDTEALDCGGGTAVMGEGFDRATGGMFEHQMPRLSPASLAFAEVLIAEVAIRNRERIKPVLPLLLEHYRRRLGLATYVTFSVEKAATGLLRLVSRLFCRPGVAVLLALALPWLIPPHARPVVFAPLAGHVSAAMRRLVRAVVGGGARAVGRSEWSAVLYVLEACAGMGGKGEADTFEAVCLLVHSNDLKEVLPAERVTACASAFFVDSGYRALGGISGGAEVDANLFACAALDLLMVLHARLPSGYGGGRESATRLAMTGMLQEVAATAAADVKEGDISTTVDASAEGPSANASRHTPAESSSAGGIPVGGGEDSEHGKGLESFKAWMMIMRALSLGGRSEQKKVVMHALQLLTKAVLDDQAQEAPPEVLRELLLTVVLPLGAHVWSQEGQNKAPESQRGRRHRHSSWNRIESRSSSGSIGGGAVRVRGGTAEDHRSSPDHNRSGVVDDGLRHHTQSDNRCRDPRSCNGKRSCTCVARTAESAYRETTDRRRSESTSSAVAAGSRLRQNRGDAAAYQTVPSAPRSDPGGAIDNNASRGGSAGLSLDAAETTEEGFELIEAPTVGLSADRASSSRSASNEAPVAASGGVVRGEGAFGVPRRQFSKDENSSEDAGTLDSEEGGSASPSGDGEDGDVQLSSPALLALLLVFKSFLTHLPSLRCAADFYEVWRQFLCCVETLLGTETTAPPALVDGALAGLAAVLGEMHREGLFAMATGDAAVKDAQETSRIWALTRAKVPRFHRCKGLLYDVLEGGDGVGQSPHGVLPAAVAEGRGKDVGPGNATENGCGSRVGCEKRE